MFKTEYMGSIELNGLTFRISRKCHRKDVERVERLIEDDFINMINKIFTVGFDDNRIYWYLVKENDIYISYFIDESKMLSNTYEITIDGHLKKEYLIG